MSVCVPVCMCVCVCVCVYVDVMCPTVCGGEVYSETYLFSHGQQGAQRFPGEIHSNPSSHSKSCVLLCIIIQYVQIITCTYNVYNMWLNLGKSNILQYYT